RRTRVQGPAHGEQREPGLRGRVQAGHAGPEPDLARVHEGAAAALVERLLTPPGCQRDGPAAPAGPSRGLPRKLLDRQLSTWRNSDDPDDADDGRASALPARRS